MFFKFQVLFSQWTVDLSFSRWGKKCQGIVSRARMILTYGPPDENNCAKIILKFIHKYRSYGPEISGRMDGSMHARTHTRKHIHQSTVVSTTPCPPQTGSMKKKKLKLWLLCFSSLKFYIVFKFIILCLSRTLGLVGCIRV